MAHRVQIDDTLRQATDDETARIEAIQAEAAAQAAAVEAQAAARESALSKLAALGLTEPEIAALLS